MATAAPLQQKLAAMDRRDGVHAMDLGFYEACKSMGLSDTQYRGLSKVAMEKLAAVDAQDHANAIDVGFVDACRAMKLNDADTRALHKVASERVEAFLQKKHAADAKVK